MFTTNDGFAVFVSTGKNVELYQSRIKAFIPDFLSMSYNGKTGDVVVAAGTIDEQRNLTKTEQDAIQAILDVDYSGEVLVSAAIEISKAADRTFYELSELITSERIDALKIQEWQVKEQLVLAWILAGKPIPAADNTYSLAFYEAQGDPDKTPAQLMESWLVNATNWRNLNTAYIAWRQGFRARIKTSTTEVDLAILRDGIEGELYVLLGIG